MSESRKTFIAEKIQKSIDFQEFWKQFEAVAEKNKGVTEGYNQYMNINWARANRWMKQGLAENPEISSFASQSINEIWLVITEFWCGDAAHNLPFVQMLADKNPSVEVRYLFRDENLDLMDDYLSPTGGRSIPIVVRIHKETLDELGSWGPRPAEAQELFLSLKKTETPLQEQINTLQKWYNAHKGTDVLEELLSLYH